MELVPISTLREACELLLGDKVEAPRLEAAAPRADARPAEKLAAPRPVSSMRAAVLRKEAEQTAATTQEQAREEGGDS